MAYRTLLQTTAAILTLKRSQNGRRDRGDLKVTAPEDSRYSYYVSPYNLGWCDPKKRYYLRRTGTMHFVQINPARKISFLSSRTDGK